MPQFRPLWWINIISWTLLSFTFLLWFNQSISLPRLLRSIIFRTKLLFH